MPMFPPLLFSLPYGDRTLSKGANISADCIYGDCLLFQECWYLVFSTLGKLKLSALFYVNELTGEREFGSFTQTAWTSFYTAFIFTKYLCIDPSVGARNLYKVEARQQTIKASRCRRLFCRRAHRLCMVKVHVRAACTAGLFFCSSGMKRAFYLQLHLRFSSEYFRHYDLLRPHTTSTFPLRIPSSWHNCMSSGLFYNLG